MLCLPNAARCSRLHRHLPVTMHLVPPVSARGWGPYAYTSHTCEFPFYTECYAKEPVCIKCRCPIEILKYIYCRCFKYLYFLLLLSSCCGSQQKKTRRRTRGFLCQTTDKRTDNWTGGKSKSRFLTQTVSHSKRAESYFYYFSSSLIGRIPLMKIRYQTIIR